MGACHLHFLANRTVFGAVTLSLPSLGTPTVTTTTNSSRCRWLAGLCDCAGRTGHPHGAASMLVQGCKGGRSTWEAMRALMNSTGAWLKPRKKARLRRCSATLASIAAMRCSTVSICVGDVGALAGGCGWEDWMD